jgi:guanylate kinase
MAESQVTGKCIIFSAPSGAGKTTIVRHLLAQELGLEFSISACSREPRNTEKHGVDYYFLGTEGFKEKITENAFVEWEEVYADNFYGTLKSEIERIWKAGKTVIFDVDVIGGLNLKNQLKEQALAIFVQPPSVEELEKRLRYRSTETEEKIQMRMSKAREELALAPKFDVILENIELEIAFKQASDLVKNFLK